MACTESVRVAFLYLYYVCITFILQYKFVSGTHARSACRPKHRVIETPQDERFEFGCEWLTLKPTALKADGASLVSPDVTLREIERYNVHMCH